MASFHLSTWRSGNSEQNRSRRLSSRGRACARSFSELNHDFASFLLTPSASLNLQMCMRGEKKKASLEGSRGKSENKNLDNKVQLQKGAHLVWENHYCSRMMYLQVTSVDIFYVPAGMFFVVPCSRYCSFITR